MWSQPSIACMLLRVLSEAQPESLERNILRIYRICRAPALAGKDRILSRLDQLSYLSFDVRGSHHGGTHEKCFGTGFPETSHVFRLIYSAFRDDWSVDSSCL